MAGQGDRHHGIRGSAALATQAVAPLAPEALEPGEMRRLPFAGELLGAARVRAAYAAIPLDAFDEAPARLEIEEQAAYLHLLRLSYGEGRNFCRAGKRELMARLRLTERRLLKVLDGLVEKGFARPLHRDNRGTLWRVFLPREAEGRAPGDEVLLGRPALAAAPEPAGRLPVRRAGPLAAPAPARSPSRAGEGARGLDAAAVALARRLADARGDAGPEGLAEASREISDLLAEGLPPARVAAAVDTACRRASAAERGRP